MKTTEPPPQTTTPTNATPPPGASDAPAGALSLTTRHRAPFDQARATIIAQYGISPVPDELMRLWLASATPWQVVRVFEEGVLNITGSDLAGTDDEQFVLCL